MYNAGRPDFVIESMGPNGLRLGCVEGKHNHNLFPTVDADPVTGYNCAAGLELGYRFAYPIGQLLGYMRDNGYRLGVLTTACRTYFLLADVRADDGRLTVRITNAYAVDEPGYLRVFAFALLEVQRLIQSRGRLDWPAEEPELPQRELDSRPGACQCAGKQVRARCPRCRTCSCCITICCRAASRKWPSDPKPLTRTRTTIAATARYAQRGRQSAGRDELHFSACALTGRGTGCP